MSDPHTPPIIQPHFPNSAWVHAPERFVLRGGRWRKIAIPVRYCMFEHPTAGTCLIDTGYTTRVTQGRRPLLLRAYAGVLRPRLTAEALTSDTKVDVILISHLHADHVSGLKDHTNAQLYVHGGGARHFAEGSHFGRIRHGVFDSLLPDQFSQTATLFEDLAVVDCPLGLGPGWDVFGDGSLLAVDLPGHMRGHVGFVFPTAASGPLLYAADAQWLKGAIMEDRVPGPPAAWIMDDLEADRKTRARIKAFVRTGGRLVMCHDPQPIELA